jgi:o-succinylbenzoate synthase
MRVQALFLHPYKIPMIHGQIRSGVIIEIRDVEGNIGWGEIAPLPKWSQETLEEALDQLFKVKHVIFSAQWKEQFPDLKLYPSVEFGLESALLELEDPLPPFSATVSAFFLGKPKEILEQAKQRKAEGFTTAKLKVGHLSLEEAEGVIYQLQGDFRLRIDVNRAWDTEKSLRFFSNFSEDSFDYVEEPFQNPKDLGLFCHPLAVDESFPTDLSFEDLEKLPALKAVIYKPTIQGGLSHCFELHQWAVAKRVLLILSSCFESDVGLSSVACMARRLGIQAPLGIGTYHYMLKHPWINSLKLQGCYFQWPASHT